MRERYLYRSRGEQSIWAATRKLIGHLAAAGVIFAAFILLEWLAGYLLDWLNHVHPFHEDTLKVLATVSIYLTYIDWVVCIVVILTGAVRFLIEVIRGDI